MIYIGTIAMMDNVPDLMGENLSADVELPTGPIPVSLGFRPTHRIGWANVIKEGDRLIARIEIAQSILDPVVAQSLVGTVGGKILERKGKTVMRWKLDEIGLTDAPCDKRLPKLILKY